MAALGYCREALLSRDSYRPQFAALGAAGPCLESCLWSQYGVVRFVLGFVLLAAGLLKFHQLMTEPKLTNDPFLLAWLRSLLADLEILLGVWLLSGRQLDWGRRLAIGSFFVFAVAASIQMALGRGSCGCFGKIELHPGYSLMIDLSALLSLCVCDSRKGHVKRAGRLSLRGIAIASLTIALLWSARAASAAFTVSAFTAANDALIVEPSAWIGHRLPLAGYLDVMDEVTDGEWILLFYRHTCPKCEDAVAKLREFGERAGSLQTPTGIALIELPPYGREPVATCFPAIRGRLTDNVEWFLETPLILRVVDGQVEGRLN